MSWLPDAEMDPHPRLTWAFECCFDFGIRALYRQDVILPDDLDTAGGQLVLSNHQRSCDVPILASAICRRSGLRIRGPLPFFVSREDIYSKSFLRELLEEATWAPWLVALIGRIPLGGVFRVGRVEPLRRVREFSLGEAVAQLCAEGMGEQPAQRWLRPTTLQRIKANHGEMPATLADVNRLHLSLLEWRPWGLRRLQLTALRYLQVGFRAVVELQLRRLADLLDAGRTVYMAPEGNISRTGHLQGLRAGAARICALTRQPALWRPVAIAYDPIAPGRMRAAVHVGAARPAPDAADRRTFDAELRRALLGLYAVTPSHLLARWLAAGPAVFDEQDLAMWLARAINAISAAGLTLDPLLQRIDMLRLLHRRLRWLAHRRLLRYGNGQWHNQWPADSPPGWHQPAHVVRYMDNGLADVLATAPGLAQQIKP